VDTCAKGNNPCDTKATCRLRDEPEEGVECGCPGGTHGSGFPCSKGGGGGGSSSATGNVVTVGFDGFLTEESEGRLERGEVCGCEKAVVDACVGQEGAKCDEKRNEVCQSDEKGESR